MNETQKWNFRWQYSLGHRSFLSHLNNFQGDCLFGLPIILRQECTSQDWPRGRGTAANHTSLIFNQVLCTRHFASSQACRVSEDGAQNLLTTCTCDHEIYKLREILKTPGPQCPTLHNSHLFLVDRVWNTVKSWRKDENNSSYLTSALK